MQHTTRQQDDDKRQLISTLSGKVYPFGRTEEFADNGESLEVVLPKGQQPVIRQGRHIWERFAGFLPFRQPDLSVSPGEGNTPLLGAGSFLSEFAGSKDLWLKNETMNPTWSFKDRGTLTTTWMAREMGEKVTATISTGNMGHSVAAYAARAGMQALVFVPDFTPREKIMPMALHGARIIRVESPDYAAMKKKILEMAGHLGLRIVSGNGPMRVEGYKLTAFEMYEQMDGEVPDYIVVPVSACGHIRGLFKGYRELYQAGYISALPRMVVVQAANNAPVATAIQQGKKQVVPFTDVHTIAEAITTGNPMGGEEIIDKAYRHDWPAMSVTENEILQAQVALARSGFFVEPASATPLAALQKLTAQGTVKKGDRVVLMLTGSGLKDFDVFRHHQVHVYDCTLHNLETTIEQAMQ